MIMTAITILTIKISSNIQTYLKISTMMSANCSTYLQISSIYKTSRKKMSTTTLIKQQQAQRQNKPTIQRTTRIILMILELSSLKLYLRKKRRKLKNCKRNLNKMKNKLKWKNILYCYLLLELRIQLLTKVMMHPMKMIRYRLPLNHILIWIMLFHLQV